MNSPKKTKQPPPNNYDDSSDCCISPRMKKHLNSLGHGSRLRWFLKEDQILYIQKYYNYTVSPYLYSIDTIKDLPYPEENAPAILKDLREGVRKGRKQIVRILKKQEKSLLNELGISYEPAKYIISPAISG